jgi:hypothetical protein
MPNGFGGGFGFRGWSPPWPYVGRGRGGLPRCWSDIGTPFPYYPMSSEQEQATLRSQAQMLRQWLEEIERKAKDLEAKD